MAGQRAQTTVLNDGIVAIDTEYTRSLHDASHLIVEKGRAAFVDTGVNSSVPLLLDALVQQDLDVADVDYNYSEVPFIQQSFLFTLHLLKQHGEKMTFTSVYEDDFLRAFPMLIDEMDSSPYSTPEKDLRYCYYFRAYKRFLVFLGLAELEVIKNDKSFDHKYKIKKTPLFDAAIHFNFLDSKTDKTIHSIVHGDYLH